MHSFGHTGASYIFNLSFEKHRLVCSCCCCFSVLSLFKKAGLLSIDISVACIAVLESNLLISLI